jgi:hypothetical protein
MKQLNERLNQFINNNFNYTYGNNKDNNISPSESNKSNENEMDTDYMMNMINQCNPDFEENNDEDERNEKQLHTVLAKLLKKQKEKSPNSQVKSFINNKLNSVLTNSNLTEKLLLYNLISSNKSQSNNGVHSDNLWEADEFSLNKIFDQDTIEKYFQKEVIRFTIENFCKYLKDNGYTIIKSNKEESEEITKRKGMICPHTDKKHYAKVKLFNLEYV